LSLAFRDGPPFRLKNLVKTLMINPEVSMGVNRTYKDSVFSLLFSDLETLRELYCALENVTLPPDVPITINTLEGVLFMERVNDISFAVGNKLVVILEHQSTVNPNMPLLYLARLYEKIINNKDMYKSRCEKLDGYSDFVAKARACFVW
jgi:hypothetical protein